MTESRPVTLITGTRKGIGRHLAHHYANLGHHVIGCSRETPDWTLEGYTHFNADVSDQEAIKRIMAHIRKTHGKLDHLINNAGLAMMNHSLLTPLDTVEKIMRTNFFGTFLFCREATRLMKKNNFGRVVNFTTVAVPLKLEGEAIYAASKAAVNSFTQILAKELASFGITVNAIGPTPVETDLIRNVPQDKMDALIRSQAIRRYGKFDDISNVTDFFFQPSSSFITGQILYLGGV